MKKYLLLTLVLIFAASFLMIGCTDDSETEVAWKIDGDSDGDVNDIIWANGDQEWSKSSGYEYGDEETTEAKKVTVKDGKIEASVDPGTGDFEAGTVDVKGYSGSTISLNEGESQVHTITVTE